MKADWTDIVMRTHEHWESAPQLDQKIIKWAGSGITEGVLLNKIRPKTDQEKQETMAAIESLVSRGKLERKIQKHAQTKRDIMHYSNPYLEKEQIERSKVFDIWFTSPGGSLSFDVSSECHLLIEDIRSMVNMCSWMRKGESSYRVELSDDCETLTVFVDGPAPVEKN